MQNAQVYPGFSDNVINALSQKVSCMPASAKICSIFFDEMTVKENEAYNIERDEIDDFEDLG